MPIGSSSACAAFKQIGGPARTQAAPRPGAVPPRWAAAAAGQRQGRQLAVRRAAAVDTAAAAAEAEEARGGAAGIDGETEWVGRRFGGGGAKLGAPLRVRPELTAELRPLAALAGMADVKKLSRAVAAAGPERERRVVQHGPAVAELLLSVGVQRMQVAELLLACPLLFSWPADGRAALLFGQLAQLRLTAAEAARCLVQYPSAANARSFEPAIAVLAPLFAAGSKASGSKSGEQLLSDLLRKQPSAVGLLLQQPSTLQERIINLMQQYGPHWKQQNKQAVIVAAMSQQHSWVLLKHSQERLLAQEAALQQEVGQQPGDGTRLLAAVVQHCAQATNCSPETLRRRALALVAEFGREPLLRAKPQPAAAALACKTSQWQRVLAVWRLLGVGDPAAVARRNLKLVTIDWLSSVPLAALVAMQRLLPWQPTAADVVQHFASYVSIAGPARVTSRLLFLQQEGLLPLLVANKRTAKQQWRQQRGLRAGQAADEPLFIGLRDVAIESDARFCALLAELQAAQPEPAGSSSSSSNNNNSSSSSGDSVAERYRAFTERLPQLAAYQQLQAAGEAQAQWLRQRLPPELLSQEAVELEDAQELILLSDAANE